MLASPQIEATAFPGKTSAGMASMLASAPVYPVIAIATNVMDRVAVEARTAGIDANINAMKSVVADFLAMFTDIPRRIRTPESAPPNTLPIPAKKNGSQAYFPIAAMSKWRAALRYAGNQKM